MMKSLFAFLQLTLLTFGAVRAQDQSDFLLKQFNVGKSGLAIGGYDPVAYFTAQKALQGKKEISSTIGGITYRFISVENRDVFKSAPAKYQPQCGGWCAYAMAATGEKVEVDPQTFKVVDGKLFLFYNKLFNNTKKLWDKDENRLKRRADDNWNKIYNSK